MSTTAINLFLSFHIDTTLFDAATPWWQEADANVDPPVTAGTLLTFDMVEAALLQPSTGYTLYVVSTTNGDDTVHKLFDFTTDDEPTADITGEPFFYSMPVERTFTVKQNDPFLLMPKILNFSAATTWSDSNFKTNGVDNTLTFILANGGTTLARSSQDNSLYFTAKANSPLGTYVMTSKKHHENTTIPSGKEFVITITHGLNIHLMNLVFQ